MIHTINYSGFLKRNKLKYQSHIVDVASYDPNDSCLYS